MPVRAAESRHPHAQGSSPAQVPELDSVAEARCRESHPVRRERNPADGRLAKFEHQQFFTAGDVPELDFSAFIARRETRALGRENQTMQPG